MNRQALLLLVLLGIGLLAAPVWSHEKKAERENAEEAAPVGAQLEARPSPPAAKPPPPVTELLLAHMHNKLVHFPIALGLTGALFLWLAWKWVRFEEPARVLWLLGAVAAVAAVVAGEAQEEAFEATRLYEIVELHETLGIATAVSLWVGVLLLWVPRLKRLAWPWTFVVAALILATGFYGGMLAHPE